MLRSSIRARELVLVDPLKSSRLIESLAANVKLLSASILRRFSSLTAFVDAYGIRGKHFERTFHAKELYEIFWGSMLVYQNFYYVVNPVVWYSSLAVLLVNCWSTPLIYALFGHANHRATRVGLCLLVDVVLDFVSSIALPYIVYFEYRTLITEPRRLDPVWVFLVGSGYRYFATNNIDTILARALPSASIALNLSSIKHVLQRRSGGFRKVQHAVQSDPLSTFIPLPQMQMQMQMQTRSRGLMLLHGGFLAYGLGALLLVLLGERKRGRAALPGCSILMEHWIVAGAPYSTSTAGSCHTTVTRRLWIAWSWCTHSHSARWPSPIVPA